MRMVNLYMFENLKEKLVGDKSGAVTQGILVWVSAAIMLVVMVPVINAIITSTPFINGTTNPTMNTTQSTVTAMVGNSFNLIVVVLIILAAVIILGVIGYLQGGRE
jgi:hypothetical protein